VGLYTKLFYAIIPTMFICCTGEACALGVIDTGKSSPFTSYEQVGSTCCLLNHPDCSWGKMTMLSNSCAR